MSVDEQHVAFPKLYKAPAYARPPAPVEPSDRPFDPDEMPLLAEQTPAERGLLGDAPATTLAAARPAAVSAGAYVAPPPAVVRDAPTSETVRPVMSPPQAPAPAEMVPEAIAPEPPTADAIAPEPPTADAIVPEPPTADAIAPEPPTAEVPAAATTAPAPELASRPFSLRALTDRLRGRSD